MATTKKEKSLAYAANIELNFVAATSRGTRIDKLPSLGNELTDIFQEAAKEIHGSLLSPVIPHTNYVTFSAQMPETTSPQTFIWALLRRATMEMNNQNMQLNKRGGVWSRKYICSTDPITDEMLQGFIKYVENK
ncbi:REP element-mobilizing transposase RayT [Weissella uvarum]|uniref:transposase n=1 Tax=Weissella uvarum TaxID=1479233 RepID=UPI00195F8E6E|nr:transposase [Weissella uvarum]MBM7617852.1 REP element-mobilizing transposase RayT [Weissella uvarum]MCM0596150.1 hypothetical protein [Weissella uvarum]